jgi:hypothetical protein
MFRVFKRKMGDKEEPVEKIDNQPSTLVWNIGFWYGEYYACF